MLRTRQFGFALLAGMFVMAGVGEAKAGWRHDHGGSCCQAPSCAVAVPAPTPVAPGATAVTQSPTTTQSNRSFSYEPGLRTYVAPTMRYESRNPTPTFLLQKTDPRKYGG